MELLSKAGVSADEYLEWQIKEGQILHKSLADDNSPENLIWINNFKSLFKVISPQSWTTDSNV